MDEAGVFHKVPGIDDARLAEIFAREVLAILIRKELRARLGTGTARRARSLT